MVMVIGGLDHQGWEHPMVDHQRQRHAQLAATFQDADPWLFENSESLGLRLGNDKGVGWIPG